MVVTEQLVDAPIPNLSNIPIDNSFPDELIFSI